MGILKKEKGHAHTCPVWAGYLLVCPLRRIFHNPGTILKPYIKPGMKVLEVGPGMGFFTLPMAERVGPNGMVYAVDIQEKMLEVLKKRARKKDLSERIETILASDQTLGIGHLRDLDFCLLFAVVHEVSSPERLFEEIATVLRDNATVLMAEPKGHVTKESFQRFIDIAKEKGFIVVSEPKIFRSMAVLFKKTSNSSTT